MGNDDAMDHRDMWACGGMQVLCHVLYIHDSWKPHKRSYLVGLLLPLFFNEKINLGSKRLATQVVSEVRS